MNDVSKADSDPGSRSFFSRLLREPVTHFFLLGILIFSLYGLVSPGGWSLGKKNRVIISEDFVEMLGQQHKKRTGRMPNPEEEKGLVDRYIREEVFYREGLKLGLNRGDSIIRRRIVQKMEFLFIGRGAVKEPSEADLAQYLEAHAESFKIPSGTSFTHIFFSREKRGERALQDAQAVLNKLKKESADVNQGRQWSDPFLLLYDFKYKSREDITGIFGAGFAKQVESLEKDTWSEPIPSIFGFHLVRVMSRKPAVMPQLNTVYKKILRAWVDEQQEKAVQEAFNRLRKRYEIIIEEK